MSSCRMTSMVSPTVSSARQDEPSTTSKTSSDSDRRHGVRQESDRACSFDCGRQLSLMAGTGSSDAARDDLAPLRQVVTQTTRVLVVDTRVLVRAKPADLTAPGPTTESTTIVPATATGRFPSFSSTYWHLPRSLTRRLARQRPRPLILRPPAIVFSVAHHRPAAKPPVNRSRACEPT